MVVVGWVTMGGYDGGWGDFIGSCGGGVPRALVGFLLEVQVVDIVMALVLIAPAGQLTWLHLGPKVVQVRSEQRLW